MIENRKHRKYDNECLCTDSHCEMCLDGECEDKDCPVHSKEDKFEAKLRQLRKKKALESELEKRNFRFWEAPKHKLKVKKIKQEINKFESEIDFLEYELYPVPLIMFKHGYVPKEEPPKPVYYEKDRLFLFMFGKANILLYEKKYSEALSIYDELYQELLGKAGNYARKSEGELIQGEEVRTLNPQFLFRSLEYMSRDNLACRIVNSMGVIHAKLGDKKQAKSYFAEAMDFIPEGFDYPDPGTNLEN